jgi:glycosyltransferase involved in cell wall biosynthesis
MVLPFPVFGSAEDYAVILGEGLQARGWEVTLGHVDGCQMPDNVDPALAIRQLPDSQSATLRMLREHQGILHINQAAIQVMASARLARVHPTVVTVHTPALPDNLSRKGRVLRHFAVRGVDAWIALSEENRRLLAQKFGVRTDLVHPVHTGLPRTRFEHSNHWDGSDLGLRSNELVVGIVGRLSPEKRHDILLSSFSTVMQQVPKAKLLIVGEGDERARIERSAALLPSGSVVLAGHRADVVKMLPRVDIFVLCSDFEGLPFALLEAMATARPIVTTDVQGASEAVRNGLEGLVVPKRDPTALAAAILRLAQDRDLATRLGMAARRRFLSEFVAERMVERTESIYLDLLSGKRR